MQRPTVSANWYGITNWFVICKDRRVSNLSDVFYIKQIKHIKSIDYAYKFILNTHFVMQILQALDILPSLPPFLL